MIMGYGPIYVWSSVLLRPVWETEHAQTRFRPFSRAVPVHLPQAGEFSWTPRVFVAAQHPMQLQNMFN